MLDLKFLILDFEEDLVGNALLAGQIIDDELSPLVTISSGSQAKPPIVFDSSIPTGGDLDLGTPNSDFGGAGEGAGGSAGSPGENNEPLGNVLIIAQNTIDANGDGLVDVPNDNGNGGTIYFDFSSPVTVSSIKALDVNDKESLRVEAYDAYGTIIKSVYADNLGRNSVQTLEIDAEQVAQLKIISTDSFAIDDLVVGVPTSSVGDTIFEDSNANGVQDSGESGIGNVTVQLIDKHQNIVIATAITDAHGNYLFDDLDGGNYSVLVTDSNGVLSGLTQTADPDETLDSMSLVTLAQGEHNLDQDFGYSTLEPNLSAVWLGFDFDSDADLEVIDERVFDLDGDGDFLNDDLSDELVPFLAPRVGGTFAQTFSVTNTGGAGKNIRITLDDNSSPFVELSQVTGPGVSFNSATKTVTIASIGAGETIDLLATSTIVNGDGTLTEARVTFDLIDDPTNPLDFGDASGELIQYWSGTGFTTGVNETTFAFAPFTPSVLALDLDGDNTADAISDELNLLRVDGSLLEGSGGLEPGTEHQSFGLEIDGDTDARSRTTLRTRSIIFEGDDEIGLSLAWVAPPGLDLTVFSSLVADGELTSADTQQAFEEFLRLANEVGIFAEVFAAPSVVSGGNFYTSELSGQRFNPDGTPIGAPFRQEAVSGNIVNVPLFSPTLVTNTNASGEGSLLQAILNANEIEGANIITFAGNVFTDAIPDVITLTNGLTINDDVVIDGSGLDIVVEGGNFDLITLDGASVSINGIGLEGGTTGIRLKSQESSLTLIDVTIQDSSASAIAVQNTQLVTVNLNGVSINNSGSTGITLANSGRVQFSAIDTTITGAGDDGVSIQNLNEAQVQFTNSVIDNSAANNVRLTNFSNVQLSFDETDISNSAEQGIDISNGSGLELTASNTSITGSGGDGLGIQKINGVNVNLSETDLSDSNDDVIDLTQFSNVTITIDDSTANTFGEKGIEISSGSGLKLNLGEGSIEGNAAQQDVIINRSSTDPTIITLTGNSGANVINGSAGDDLITGGAGNDVMTGNSGSDTFVIGSNSDRDVITDFVKGEDVLDVSAVGIRGLGELIFQGSKIRFDTDASNTSTSEVILQGLSANTLTADDFIFA